MANPMDSNGFVEEKKALQKKWTHQKKAHKFNKILYDALFGKQKSLGLAATAGCAGLCKQILSRICFTDRRRGSCSSS